MIRDLKDPVRNYMAPVVALKGAPANGSSLAMVPPNGAGSTGGVPAAQSKGVAYNAFEVLEPFESAHNRKITWDHLLRQTSDWQGTLWGKPDWADRPRGDVEQWKVRPRIEPGSVYSYNDVRVNALALASLTVWRRPLPQVLREYVMDPIGASNTWRWYGYDNSWVVIDGQLVQSVAGGAHWGGGLFFGAERGAEEDLALLDLADDQLDAAVGVNVRHEGRGARVEFADPLLDEGGEGEVAADLVGDGVDVRAEHRSS
jgi:CubicO group peptidase (beta-lactamase class C family)